VNRRGFFRRIAGMATAAVVVSIAEVLAPPGPSTITFDLGVDTFKFSRGEVVTFPHGPQITKTGVGRYTVTGIDYRAGSITVSVS